MVAYNIVRQRNTYTQHHGSHLMDALSYLLCVIETFVVMCKFWCETSGTVYCNINSVEVR